MESFEEHYASMCDAIKKHLPGADMALIDRAVDYANQKHKVQKRKDGSPYIIHPLAVAQIVAEMGLDCDAILGALLHDCIEDTDASHEDIEKIFGPTVAELVEGVTKLTRANFSSSEQAQMENLRKMFMAMSKDIRVVLIKIADRLHNMRTMQYQTPEKQIQKCRETMDVYAPLAHRLGMQKIKWELEDTALRYLAPMEYNEIMSYLQAHKEKDEAFMRTIQDKITQRLTSVGIHNTTYGRIKHVYSIYRKMFAQNKTMDEIFDLYAFRVIVDTIPDCYNVLGHVHDLFSLVPGRFKDYISTPKPNMYQSLHTTVIGPYGTPVEYQIRTEEMHRIDEMGILSHWIYNDSMDTSGIQNMVKSWLQSLMEIQRTSADSSEFLENIKIDLFPDRVYVFTPRSKIVSLPQGSCPVDFAYQIHTDVGNKAIGCRINGENQPLSTPLKNGDMVEIITAPDAEPDPQWISFVRSGKARAEVRQYLRTRNPEESEALGRKVLAKAAQEARLNLQAVPEPIWHEVLRDASIGTREQLYMDIGLGHMPAAGIIGQIKTLLQVKKPEHPAGEAAVSIRGTEGMAVQLATCCHPVPGDNIWGFMRKGHGLSVHRADCEHVARGRQNAPQRWMSLAWQSDSAEEARFFVPLDLEITDDRATLASVATELSSAGSAIVGVNVEPNKEGKDSLNLMIQVRSRLHLMHIMRALKRIPTVLNVARRLDGDKRIFLPSEDR